VRAEEKRRVEFMIFRGHRVKNEKKTISNRGTVAVWSGGGAVRWQCKGTAIFQTVSPAARAPSRCPMVIRYFFPNVHANTPFTYPLPIATKFTLSLGMKIRVVAATRPFGVTFMRNWVIRWKQLSVLKRKRRCRRRNFRWNVVGPCPGRFSRENDRWPK